MFLAQRLGIHDDDDDVPGHNENKSNKSNSTSKAESKTKKHKTKSNRTEADTSKSSSQFVVDIRTLSGLRFEAVYSHSKVTIDDVLRTIETQLCIPIAAQELSLNNFPIDLSTSQTLSSCGFRSGDTLTLLFNKQRYQRVSDPASSTLPEAQVSKKESSSQKSKKESSKGKRKASEITPAAAPSSASANSSRLSLVHARSSPPPHPPVPSSHFAEAMDFFVSRASERKSREAKEESKSTVKSSSSKPPSYESGSSSASEQANDILRQARTARMEAIRSSIAQSAASLRNASNASLGGEERVVKVDEEALNALTTTMGFRKEASTRALILNRNSMEAALNWLLENANDPDLSRPISDDEMEALSRISRRHTSLESFLLPFRRAPEHQILPRDPSARSNNLSDIPAEEKRSSSRSEEGVRIRSSLFRAPLNEVEDEGINEESFFLRNAPANSDILLDSGPFLASHMDSSMLEESPMVLDASDYLSVAERISERKSRSDSKAEISSVPSSEASSASRGEASSSAASASSGSSGASAAAAAAAAIPVCGEHRANVNPSPAVDPEELGFMMLF